MPENRFNLQVPSNTPGKESKPDCSLFKFKPMVQVETSQLTAECQAWREALRKYREEFGSDKAKLQETASQPLSKDQLQDVEHLHNQFHIQLINIHDLKHRIKSHCRAIEMEMNGPKSQVKEETLAAHEQILEEYQNLDQTLQDLRGEFERFLSHA